jgi:hypothetical protein
MSLADIDGVNHLVAALNEMRSLVHVAEQAEPAMFQLFIESGGDGSPRVSSEGSSTSHAGGVAVSPAFLAGLKELALGEPRARQDAILTEPRGLGVDAEGGA